LTCINLRIPSAAALPSRDPLRTEFRPSADVVTNDVADDARGVAAYS
jgi:hypothetical protein